jgi:hypothetical protein
MSNKINQGVMKRKMFLIWIVLTQAIVVAAQTNDDLYYRPSKKTENFRAEKTIDHYTNSDKPYEEPPFSSPENGQSDATANAGNHVTNNGNDNSQQRKGISTSEYDDGYGNTYVTNNYYGDYYNNDYPSYTARINRFYRPAIGWGYYNCYFDPFWDPWWGWNGWGFQPGFSISFGWGWPWWYGGWGWNWGWGWGWNSWAWNWGWYWGNPYWNGYFHGYWNGFYDGLYGNYWNTNWWAGANANPNRFYYGPRRMAAPVQDNNNATVNAGDVNTPRVIKSELPAVNDNNRAITTNRYTRDVKPIQSYGPGRTPESYSINKNKSDLRPSDSDNSIVSQPGKTGIRVSKNNPHDKITPPRTNRFEDNISQEPNIRTKRGTTGIRMYDHNRPENTNPRTISPAHQGNGHGRNGRNEYRNQPSYRPDHSSPHGIRNNHHIAPMRNHTPSMSAPSRGGGGAVSPAPVSPGNFGRGGRGMH